MGQAYFPVNQKVSSDTADYKFSSCSDDAAWGSLSRRGAIASAPNVVDKLANRHPRLDSDNIVRAKGKRDQAAVFKER